METAHPESVVPARAQALFTDVPFKLRHPFLLAMPYPDAVGHHLHELEKYTCLALDPECGHELRCAAIRFIGRWLWDHAADMNVEAFFFDLVRLLDRLPFSIDLMHAFAMAHLKATGIRIERDHRFFLDRKTFVLMKDARGLSVGHMVDVSLRMCLDRSQSLLNQMSWQGEFSLDFNTCYKAADLLFMYELHGTPLTTEWTPENRLDFHATTSWKYWKALADCALSKRATEAHTATALKMASLDLRMYDAVGDRLIEATKPARATTKHHGASDPIKDAAAAFSASSADDVQVVPHRIVVWGPVPPANDAGDKAVLARFKPLESPLPVALMPEVARLEEIKDRLLAEFPWATEAIGTIFDELITRRRFGAQQLHLRPVLLLGPPGVGKTRFARRFAEEMELEFRAIGLGGMSDIRSLTGTSRGWSTGQPSVLLEPLLNDQSASALVLLDEIDKANDGERHTPPASSFLLGLLEPENARRWFDSFLQTDCDLSRMVFIATANDLTWLSNALLSRFTILDFGRPTAADMRKTIPFALEDIAQDWGLPKEVFASIVPLIQVKVPNMRELKVFLTRYLAAWANLHMPSELRH